MLTFAVSLRSGGDYIIDDAITLSRQVRRHMRIPHRFVCLSDLSFDDPYIDVLPLKQNWPGWWCVTELFRLTGPVIATGLDSVIINSIDRLGELALSCSKDIFYMTKPQLPGLRKGKKMNSGIMIWNGDWTWLYKQFKTKYIPRFKAEEKYTIWQLTENKIKVRLVQDYFDGFYSYKLSIRGKSIPEDAKFIAFHGKPRPSQCEDQWVQDVRNDLSVPFHSFAAIEAA